MTHPITPPPELVQQWASESLATQNLCNRAAQWGADQELEACCEWLVSEGWFKYEHEAVEDLRAARRPPSLKEQALELARPAGTEGAHVTFGPEELAPESEDACCLLELRARVETLEAAAHKHIVETSANILALVSRIESLEAAERPASKVYEISKPLKLTAKQQAELHALLKPNSKPALNSNQVGSSLVDRVARAIGRDDEPTNWEEEARAAIRMVALWLNEVPLDLYPGDCGIVVNTLYDQANQ